MPNSVPTWDDTEQVDSPKWEDTTSPVQNSEPSWDDTQPVEKPSFLQSIVNNLPHSAAQIDAEDAKNLGAGLPPQVFPPYWLGAAAEKIAPSLPEGFAQGAAQGFAGVNKGAAEALSGFTTPTNMALLSAAPAGKVAERLIAGVFLGQEIAGTPAQWEAFKAAPTLSEKAQIATGMGLGYALPGLGFLHAGKGEKPTVATAHEELAPSGDGQGTVGEPIPQTQRATPSVDQDYQGDALRPSPESREAPNNNGQRTPANKRPDADSFLDSGETARPASASEPLSAGEGDPPSGLQYQQSPQPDSTNILEQRKIPELQGKTISDGEERVSIEGNEAVIEKEVAADKAWEEAHNRKSLMEALLNCLQG
jgi:hypothetical protein